MSPVPSCRRIALLAATTIASAAATAAPALATTTSAQCPGAAVSNPFAPWGDDADYWLAADFEDDGAGWSLTGGADVRKGNETYMVGSAHDKLSMRLPGSSTAMSQRMCIGGEHPSFRFFAKRTGGSAAGRLVVDVVFEDASGVTRTLPVGSVKGSDSWAATDSLPTVVDEIAAQQGSAVDASYRFTPQGGGVWSIDDVYVDPHRII